MRLDSWKAIAEYLGRDVATVRRWEKTQGLPVRRIPGGRGHSVFAFAAEIDEWLKARGPHATNGLTAAADAPAADPPPAVAVTVAAPAAAPRAASRAVGYAAIAVLVFVGALAAGWWWSSRAVAAEDLRIETTASAVIGRRADGSEQWRHQLPAGYRSVYSELGQISRILTGGRPAVLVASSHRYRIPDDVPEGGTLMQFTLRGALERSFSFDDDVTLDGEKFGGPWPITTFAVSDRGSSRRVAVASHHWLWDPSLVTILDDDWKRTATFVHRGWIEALAWIADDRLVIGGFEQSENGGMVGLVDPNAVSTPLRKIAMPRSELNLVTGSRFNRALIEVTADRVIARTVEVPDTGQGAIDAIYEFTPALELLRASYSERYWELHTSLEMQGKLNHPREKCAGRNGPPGIRIWTSESGWASRTLLISSP